MKVQISNGMFIALIINMVYAKGIGLTQGSMAREVMSDIWISTIISSFFGILLMLLVIAVIKRLPEHDLIKQSEVFFGPWIGKLFAVVIFIFFTGAFATKMVVFVYHLKDYFLPDAPVWLFIVVGIVVGGYAIYFGIEVVARMALIGVFSVLSLNILLLFGSLERFDIRELLPIFQSGFIKPVWASRHAVSDWAVTTMMAALILPLVQEPKTWRYSGVSGILFTLGFILMWPILEVGVLSPEVTAQYIISCMQMARSAQIGLYIHRYEMIMVAFFALSVLTQIMMSLFCATVSIQRIFNVSDYRKLIFPVSVVLGAFGYWITKDHSRAMTYVEYEWVGISHVIALCVPLFLWVIGFVMKDKLNKARKSAKDSSSS